MPTSLELQQLAAEAYDSDTSSTDGDASVRIGRWSKQEHARFMEGYKMFGKDWRRVADFVGTRNNVQVRTHAQKSFKKMRKLELARLKTQRIIAAHRSGLSESERARVLEQIENATRIALHEQKQQMGVPSAAASSSIMHPQQSAPGFLSPMLSPHQQHHARQAASVALGLPSLSLPMDNSIPSFMPSPPLVSPMMMPTKSMLPMSLLPPLEIASPAATPTSAGLSSPPPAVFTMNGTVFPHLASLTAHPGQQPPPQQPGRFSFQNHFKFFQDWSVDVK